MEQVGRENFDPKILKLFSDYTQGSLSKCDFLQGASQFVEDGITASAVLDRLQPEFSKDSLDAQDDQAIISEWVEYNSPQGHGRIRGLMARPRDVDMPLPAVLVVHEDRGLTPHIEDIVRRFAQEGFLAFGPDGLTPLGGYPGDEDKGLSLQNRLDRARLKEDFFAAYEFLKGRKNVSGKVGAVGFCFGGEVCNALAVAYPDLAACVPIYGRQPKASEVAHIKAPLLLHYGALDAPINKGWPDFRRALDVYEKQYDAYFYEKANHGFVNDATPYYSRRAAKLTWSRTINFLKVHLNWRPDFKPDCDF